MTIWMNLKGKYEVIQEGAVLQVKLNFTCLEKNLNEINWMGISRTVSIPITVPKNFRGEHLIMCHICELSGKISNVK